MSADADKQTLDFQAEVRQLLDLMVHSVYGRKEIFLRELISNASDAADKLRFESLSDEDLLEGEGELDVRVKLDPAARTLSVIDNGIGMSRDEVVENLGTIARSGTRQFFEALTGDAAKDARLVGQFGVGFYSSFMVADRVTVLSRRAGAPRQEGVRWESDGAGAFTVETADRRQRGTEVVLHLREGEDEFLDPERVRSIIRRYSDHISLPILMAAGEDGEEHEAGDDGMETVNRATALWARPRNEISDEEYEEFYKHVAHDFEAPLGWVHSRVEGKLEYTSLLYVPSRAPFDLWDRSARRGVKLYVRRVFIMDDAEQLMPAYLRFVRGVVDSADLPLNVSREILQSNRQIDSMRAACVKKILGLLQDLAENEPEKYARFWKQFGRVLKEGVVEDAKNAEAVARLLRFASTHNEGDEEGVSLDDYVGRMKEGQDAIWYVIADNPSDARSSPHLEIFKERGVEVLLMSDEVDEWVVRHLEQYRDRKLQSVTRGELDLDSLGAGGEQEGAAPADGEPAEALVERVRGVLGDRVKDVRVSSRLTASPACLVADEHDLGAHLERVLRAAGQDVPAAKPIMELNPRHELVRRLERLDDDGSFADWALLLFDQAALSEGRRLEDPAGFVQRLNGVLTALAGTAEARSS